MARMRGEFKKRTRDNRREMVIRPTGMSSAPRLEEMLELLFAQAGGPHKFADMIWKDYAGSKPGSLQRQRFASDIFRLCQAATRISEGRQAMADSTATDQDLERELKSLVSEFDAESAKNMIAEMGTEVEKLEAETRRLRSELQVAREKLAALAGEGHADG
jgi:hypothetical protein